ncbi:sensor histidine kinase [Neoroseomonas rubea]|uniref:sensor histidine kinase n=1 Tax=Neoroseomonas rubea TaxID=2748666 RepID=UPI0018DF16DE|nr:HWE histidine kinase domain-containing protein [Roseomonas rubea]
MNATPSAGLARQAPPDSGPPRPERRPGLRLAALVVAAFLLPAAILGVAAWITWTAIWDEADRELTHAAEMLAEYSHRVIDGHARIAQRVVDSLGDADDAAILAADDELRDRIARFVADLPLLRGVLVLGADGAIVLRTGAARVAPRLMVATPSGADTVLLSAAYLEEGGGQSVAVGRARAQGGTVAIVLDAERLARGMARSRGPPRESVALIRGDGQILAREPGPAAPLPALTPDRPVMAAFAAGLERSRLRGLRPQDDTRVESAFQRLEGMPGLAAVIARPRDILVEAWRRRLLPLFAIGLPAMIGLGALALRVRRQQVALEAALAGLEQRVAERTVSLREGEERLRLAVEAGRIGTWETEIATRITTRSPRAREIFGFGPEAEATPLEDWGARIHPADRARVLHVYGEVAAGRLSAYVESYRFLRPDGSWRWLESTAAVVRRDAATGWPLRLAGTVQDMTERREAEDRRDLLTQEVNHRARNTLAIVQAILRLTRAPTPGEYARLVEGRVAALARAQSLLAAERWTGAPFLTLLTDEIAPFGSTEAGPDGRFRIDGPEFRVRAEAVQPLGMVFHELATNAVKHGALSVREGRVGVTWRIDETAGLLLIRWAEDGGPSPGFPKHRGVGSRVIEATVTGQLGGTVERRWPAEGLVCDIALPLARTRAGLD